MKFSRSDVALLALRLVLGAAFLLHGFPKLSHLTTWTEHILPGTPSWLTAFDALVEFVGAIALIVGLGTQVAAALIAADMVVAVFVVLIPHGAVFVTGPRGTPTFELELTFCVVALSLVLMGAGGISLDALRSRGSGGKLGSRSRAR
jgi:putative oxidoreductase